jgi:CheY-like chemotaxis protein
MATIIFTGDDQQVRSDISALCTALGHTVLIAPSSQSVPAFLHAHVDPLIVFLDLNTWSHGIPLMKILLQDPVLRQKHHFLLCLERRAQTIPLAVKDAQMPIVAYPLDRAQLAHAIDHALHRTPVS